MKKIRFMFLISILLLAVNAFAQDMTIDSNGDVGIGETNPTSKLDVFTSSGDAIVGETTDPNGKAGVFIGNTDITGNLTVGGTVSATGLGDITGVTAGTGMMGGGTSGDITLDADPNVLQMRALGACYGQVMVEITPDGVVICEPDDTGSGGSGDITGVTAGTGLSGGGMSGNVTVNADFGGTGSAATVSRSDHAHTGSLYGKVAIVAQSGGDYTSPLDAMNNVGTWCGTPGPANSCLVRLMPGIYDLGNNGLAMQSYVDIEGSGENVTTITSTHSSSTRATSATVTGVDNAEIRFLTVENQGGGSQSYAIYNSTASPNITYVKAIASGGSGSNIGVYNYDSSSTITNVTAIGSGGSANYGVQNDMSSAAVMTDVIASASGGSKSAGVRNANSSSTVMTNVTATASGANQNYGVKNVSASPVMINVTATALGGSNTFGVHNSYSSSPKMKNVEVTALGGSTINYGVYNIDTSSPEMVDLSSNGILITGNQLFVPASGSDTENGTLLHSVSNEIIGLGAASSTNRYIIKLDAGTYDLGNNGLAMQSYVDIEGSGENTTTITSTHSSGVDDATSATLTGADNAEIRSLTVDNQGGSTFSMAIYNSNASPDITNVTAVAAGGWDNYGVYNANSSSPVMRNVTATGLPTGIHSYGVYNLFSSNPIMTNVTASGTDFGVVNVNSSPEMVDVSSNGVLITGHQVFVPASGSSTDNGTLLLGVSNEIGGLGPASSTNPFTLKLDAGTYDLGNNVFDMQSYVDIEGSGENVTIITSNHSSTTQNADSATLTGADNAEIRFLTVENRGGSTFAIAIYNDNASPYITQVTSTAVGFFCYAVYNNSSSPIMTSVTAIASGTGDNYGVFNKNNSSPTIKTSSTSGEMASISNQSGSSSKIAATMLVGPKYGGGFTCVGAYNAYFDALDASCIAPEKTVFVSSVTYNGALGGVSGADAKCQALATTAGLSGNYKAWISDDTTSLDTTFNKSSNLYKLTNGVHIAVDWSDLTDGTLANPINIDEYGASPVDSVVWTKVLSDGTLKSGPSCNGWTSNSGADSGRTGINIATDATWTDYSGEMCDIELHIYCFEQ